MPSLSYSQSCLLFLLLRIANVLCPSHILIIPRFFLIKSNEGFVLMHCVLWKKKVFLPLTIFLRVINVSIPTKTRNNGTLYALIFVHQAGVSPWQDTRQVHMVADLTTYMVPKPPEISLISMDEQAEVTWGSSFTSVSCTSQQMSCDTIDSSQSRRSRNAT